MKIVYEGASAEITEKKSRFIADVAAVSSEAEATAFIDSVKKKYWDCKHHCSAFVIGERRELTRCTDDGEPSGTAGRPILDLILGSGVTNVCIVVSRYFGGTLLGTGGLVRAYQGAAREGLAAATVIDVKAGRQIDVTVSYDFVGKLQYTAAELGLYEIASEYTDKVTFKYMADDDEALKNDYRQVIKRVTDITSGKAVSTFADPVRYAIVDGKLMIFQ